MFRSKLLSLILLIVLTAGAACTSPATSIAPSSSSTTETEGRTLTVLAAASLTEAFTELGHVFEIQQPGVKVVFSFAGSQAVAQQLGQGAGADVFASANQKYMQAVVQADRVTPDTAQTFVTNRLVVIFPRENPARIQSLQDLARPDILLDLADPSVPVGQYTINFLDKASAEAAFGAQFKTDVLDNVASYEDNVKAVVTKVSLGEADAGIVYVTDITAEAADELDYLDIPDALNTVASYPIAPLRDAQHPALAQAFVDFVLSDQGQQILAQYGFIPAISP